MVCAWLGFFGFGWYGPWVALVADVAPVERVGSALGIAMAVNQVFIVVMPPILGLLHDTSGSYALVWGALAVLLFLAGYAGRQRPSPHAE
jgi:MFS family permease